MSSPGNLDWLFHLLGWLLAAAGFGLLVWALFWDRSRGRKRCPKCWYSMEGVPGLKCPECGHEVRNERQLLRTRRRQMLACFALLVVVASTQVWSVPRIRRDGWFGAIPTSVIVWTVPLGGSEWEKTHSPDWRVLEVPKDSWLRRFMYRLDNEALWGWQSQVFLDRLFKRHPSELLNALGVPKVWPEHIPIRIRFDPGYLSRYLTDELGVRVRVRGSELAWVDSANRLSLDYGSIGSVSAPLNTTTLDVELRTSKRLMWRGTVTPPLRVEGNINKYLRGVASPNVEAWLLDSNPRVCFIGDGTTQLVLDNHSSGIEPECTIAVNVLILRDGTVVGSARIYRFNLSALTFFSGAWSDRLASHVEWLDASAHYAPDRARWEAVITPNESIAMLDYIADTDANLYNNPRKNSYWNGRLTVPLGIEYFTPKPDLYEFK